MTETSSTERGANVRFPPPLVFVIFAILGVVLHYYVMAAPWPFDRVFSTVGGMLIILIAGGFIGSARTLFVRSGQHPAPWKPSPKLIVNGLYRFTRNPMYVGLTLVQIGLGVTVGNLWICVLALLSLLTVHFIAVLPEERYLTEKFGDSYTSYVTRVRRYL